MTFLVIEDTRQWLSISNLFLYNIKVKGRQCLAYLTLVPLGEVLHLYEQNIGSIVYLKYDVSLLSIYFRILGVLYVGIINTSQEQ